VRASNRKLNKGYEMGIFKKAKEKYTAMKINGIVDGVFNKGGTKAVQKLMVKSLDKIVAENDNTLDEKAMKEIKVKLAKELRYKE